MDNLDPISPPPENVKGMPYDQLKAALWFGTPTLAKLKQYFWNTLTEKENRPKEILRIYWPLTEWLVEQVRTWFTFLPSATHISSDLSIWHLTPTSPLHIIMILTCAQDCGLLLCKWLALYSTKRADARTSVKRSVINLVQVRGLVLSYLTNNGVLNIQYNCWNSIMVVQGINYSMEHQAWLHVQQIGQQQTECTTYLGNLTTIDNWLRTPSR